jgi:hypothetical protein
VRPGGARTSARPNAFGRREVPPRRSYLITAERLQATTHRGRLDLYRRNLEVFARGVALTGESCQRVEIPYEGRHLAALYVRAEGVQRGQRAPVLVQLNGLDSTKEMKLCVGLPHGWRGAASSSLVLDQPGTGEALRLHGLTARFDSRALGQPRCGLAEQHDDVDPRRIGCEGVSLGGYFCPRAVAFEPRFACGVAWGANHDWRDVQKQPAGQGRRLPGAALLEARVLGVGRQGHRRLHAHRRATCTWTAWSRRSACPSW